MEPMKKPRSYVALAVLASCVLYFAFSLSSSGRHLIDWIVLSLISLAILWNLTQVGRRLYRTGGSKDLWHLMRTLLLWILGLGDTVFIRPEDAGSWKYIAGWVFLVLAVVDTVLLAMKEHAAAAPTGGSAEHP